MKIKAPRVTYANVVASLALFIALGGVSWAAATLPKNSVGSKQLKKNAVTAAKIKKNAVTSTKIKSNSITGSKVKNNSLTGSDINASTLGKVPSAAASDSVGSDIPPVTKRVASSASNVDFDVARLAATEVPIAAFGQVSVYAKCYLVGSSLYSAVFYRTAADGALSATTSGPSYTDSGFSASLAEMSRYFQLISTGPDSKSSISPPGVTGTLLLIGPDGNGLSISVSAGAKRGTPPSGNGPYGAGDVCMFSVSGKYQPAA